MTTATPSESHPTTAPATVVINLPRHVARREAIVARLHEAGIAFSWAAAVDGEALSTAERRSNVTPLGRALMTPGMIGCFLSHRACWASCEQTQAPLLVLEDDALLCDGFRARLCDALAALEALDRDWDVLLVGALGCIHPRGRYRANMLHGLVGGGWRWPRSLSPLIHVPARPFGTHAYVISPVGARKLRERCPRASFHVDVAAWGQSDLRLYLGTDLDGDLLVKQDMAAGDTTIGGLIDRSWLPAFTIDAYTGAEFGWAFNAPILKLGGSVLTIGRSLTSTAALFLIGATTGSCAAWWMGVFWFALQLLLIRLLRVTRWPSWPQLSFARPGVRNGLVATLAVVVIACVCGVVAAPEVGWGMAWDIPLSIPLSQPASGLLLGPAPLGHGGRAELEGAGRGMSVPRLRLTGGSAFDDASLTTTTAFVDRVLARRRPFTILWDPRHLTWPRVTPKQLQAVGLWLEDNVVAWDTHVQAHTLLLSNPIVRGLAQLLIKVFAPPQPVRIVKNEEEALAFARTCCTKPRSWVKASYATGP